MKVDFPENKTRKSGSQVRVFLTDVELELTDYYWTDEDYRRVLTDAGFYVPSTCTSHSAVRTMASTGSPRTRCPPFSIYVAGT